MEDETKTPAELADDARRVGQSAAQAAEGLTHDAKDLAHDALNTARGYARSAAGTANEKLARLKSKAADAQATATRYIADEPVKAMLIGVAAGALLATLLLHAGRARRY